LWQSTLQSAEAAPALHPGYSPVETVIGHAVGGKLAETCTAFTSSDKDFLVCGRTVAPKHDLIPIRRESGKGGTLQALRRAPRASLVVRSHACRTLLHLYPLPLHLVVRI
jgi:hypothetical protein